MGNRQQKHISSYTKPFKLDFKKLKVLSIKSDQLKRQAKRQAVANEAFGARGSRCRAAFAWWDEFKKLPYDVIMAVEKNDLVKKRLMGSKLQPVFAAIPFERCSKILRSHLKVKRFLLKRAMNRLETKIFPWKIKRKIKALEHQKSLKKKKKSELYLTEKEIRRYNKSRPRYNVRQEPSVRQEPPSVRQQPPSVRQQPP